ncbi:MAG TPA: radical SAM protein [Thermoanaerobaculia bacterium]|nr:radical SAM protein [Thermoanaerobaculia bacterium]
MRRLLDRAEESLAYPETFRARDEWIRGRRGARNVLDPHEPYGAFVEDERTESGEIVPVATLLLTNRECPWRCLMCDLWKSTLDGDTVPGAIPRQIERALARLGHARRVKLYNAGSLFDPRAVPPEDDAAIAALLAGFERVIVESHPALVGRRCLEMNERLGGRLEVAMGLETVHPDVLPRLNKGMTLDDFDAAAERLRGAGIAMRAFVLAGLPFVARGEQLAWTVAAIAHAFEAGAAAVSVIPTRTGNGAMEALSALGQFEMPALSLLEDAVALGLGFGRGRVFADLWDLAAFSRCERCLSARTERLRTMNLTQIVPPTVHCAVCA